MCTSALPSSDLPRVHSAPPDHYFLLSVFGNTRRSSSMPVVTPRALDPKVAFWGQPLPCLVVRTLPRVSPRSKALSMAGNRYDPQSAGCGASPHATFPQLGGARVRNKSTSRKRAQNTSENACLVSRDTLLALLQCFRRLVGVVLLEGFPTPMVCIGPQCSTGPGAKWYPF